MGKFISPLKIFICLFVAILIVVGVFGSMITSTADKMGTDIAPHTSNFFGLPWLSTTGVVLFIIFVMLLLVGMYEVAKYWLKRR